MQPRPPAQSDWSRDAHRALRAADVRQIATVPDAGLSRLLDRCRADRTMRVITLTTEEEGIGLIGGAWLGGMRGALLMQSSGVGNCINALAMAATCRFPCLMIVTMRGEWGEFNPWQVPMGRATREVLAAVGVLVHRAESVDLIGDTVAAAAKIAFDANQAAAVLVPQRLIGTKSFKR